MARDSVTLKPLRTLDACAAPIRKREAFTTRTRKTPYGTFVSMSGHLKSPGSSRLGAHVMGTGHLPIQYHESFDRATYYVLSYETPIAWWVPQPVSLKDTDILSQWLSGDDGIGHWVIPEVRYTTTTTSHVGEVRAALGGYGYHMRSWPTKPEPIPYEAVRAEGAPERVEYVGCERTAY